MLHKDLTGADLHVARLHAGTHLTGGTDPLTLTESQVTGLVADLATKVDWINVKSYGAVGNGITDDTAAIRGALVATPTGGTLYFPAGLYLVTGADTEIFLRERPINIVGAGMGSSIMLDTTMGATTDVFRFSPSNNGTVLHWLVANLSIIRKGGTVGRNVFTLDTEGAGRNLSGLIIDRVYAEYMNGYFVQTIARAYDGPFNLTVQSCTMLCGIDLTGGGDSLRILNNIITGPSEGIIVDLVGGAGGLQIIGNNITTDKGCVVVRASDQEMVIANNEFEQRNLNTNPNNCMIDLNGATRILSGIAIYGNNMTVLGSAGDPVSIRIDNAHYVSIFANNFNAQPSTYCIVQVAPHEFINISSDNGFHCSQGFSQSGGMSGVIQNDTAISFFLGYTFASVVFSTTYSGRLVFFVPSVSATTIIAGSTTACDAATGILTGTTGTDEHITISCHTDGKIYFENRLGGPLYYNFAVLAPIV